MNHGTRMRHARFRDDGYSHLPPISAEQREAEMARIREQDEKRQREHNAWLRLCGSAGMIGGLSER